MQDRGIRRFKAARAADTAIPLKNGVGQGNRGTAPHPGFDRLAIQGARVGREPWPFSVDAGHQLQELTMQGKRGVPFNLGNWQISIGDIEERSGPVGLHGAFRALAVPDQDCPAVEITVKGLQAEFVDQGFEAVVRCTNPLPPQIHPPVVDRLLPKATAAQL